MALVRYISSGGLLLLLCTQVLAQNPFDLVHRLGNKTETPHIDDAPQQEARHLEDSIAAKPAVQEAEQTVQQRAELTGEVQSGVPQTSSKNPFDISTTAPQRSGEVQNTERASGAIAEPQPNHLETSQSDGLSALGFVLFFVAVMLILIFVVNLNRSLLPKIYRAALNENFSSLLYRERKFSTSRYLYNISYLVFFLNGGMFLYLLARTWNLAATSYSIPVFIGGVAAVYFLRHLVMRIVSFIFPIAKEAMQFNFNIVLFNILLGLFLIPINLFLAFGPDVFVKSILIIGLTGIGLTYLLRQFRGFLIASRLASSNVFHFFLYLCTIEILPLLVLMKFFL